MKKHLENCQEPKTVKGKVEIVDVDGDDDDGVDDMDSDTESFATLISVSSTPAPSTSDFYSIIVELEIACSSEASEEGATLFILVSRENALDTAMAELSDINNSELRKTLQVRFYGEICKLT
ncbi:hypothetical protein AC249_AIPGENE18297 [Exaiptasia diaphana]|nr:hypothetical protein AC249_AIPGENE18297 [Exaiptasia diaphana]